MIVGARSETRNSKAHALDGFCLGLHLQTVPILRNNGCPPFPWRSVTSGRRERNFDTCDSIGTGVTNLNSDPQRTPFMTGPGIAEKLELQPILCGGETTQYSRDRRRLEARSTGTPAHCK
jgi:hypothetical protein